MIIGGEELRGIRSWPHNYREGDSHKGCSGRGHYISGVGTRVAGAQISVKYKKYNSY